MIRVVTTDLFAPLPLAIAHGCNAAGAMGAGVAKRVRALFPEAFEEYRQLCKSKLFSPGDVHHYSRGPQHLFNLCTQQKTGPGAMLSAIEESVYSMLRIAEDLDVPEIHVPKIGCGIGGLSWPSVHASLKKVSTSRRVLLVVHDFDPSKRGDYR